jgi:hypothetical protein
VHRFRRSCRADELYDQYVKPLESEHYGEYIAISPTGQVLLATDLLEQVPELSGVRLIPAGK